MTLLISITTENMCLIVAGLILVLCICVIVWAVRTAETFEWDEDPIEAPGQYSDIQFSERPYIESK